MTPPIPTTALTFDNEFNTFSASPSGAGTTWATTYPYGGEAARTLAGNNEAQFYSDPSVGENPFSLAGGVLSITATPAAAGSNPYGLPYDSGAITTANSFSQTYGYFEVRAELPSQQGLWPAFWMLPASINYTSELDMFEQVNNQPTTLYSTVHGATNGTWSSDSQALTVPNTASGYHTYGVDWEPTTTTFYVDDKVIGTAPTPGSMNDPMFMILNLAVGGKGSWPGQPDATTTFPAAMKIDYVRAYATAGTTQFGGTAAIPTGAPQPVLPSDPGTPIPPTTSPVALPLVSIGSGPDTLALQVSEDAWQGDAQFTVSVDGVQTGGTQTATASHGAGQMKEFDVKGAFAPGTHTASVNFLNDAYGGSASTDRNLYVTGAKVDGSAVPGGSLTEMSSGAQSFAFTGAAAPAAPATDTLKLSLSEDAWQGDAQFNVTIDGKTVGGPLAVTALHSQGKSQTFTFTGQWGAGVHDVGVQFINDAYGGTPMTDRNLYVNGVTLDGQASAAPPASLYSNGTAHIATAASPLVLQLSEDAWQGDAQFTVSVDGKTLGAAQSVTALHSKGASQDFAFGQALAAGTHDVAVSFLNDAYGGSATTDRNLYVSAIDANGSSVGGAAAALMGTSTHHFSVVVPSQF